MESTRETKIAIKTLFSYLTQYHDEAFNLGNYTKKQFLEYKEIHQALQKINKLMI